MYKKESDLICAQEALIEMGFHCLLCADYIDYDLRGMYYDILIQIIFRGEMNLGSMSIKSSSNDNLYAQKANVSILYQSFLYKNLKNCLDKLNMKGIDYLQRNYIEKFLAVAFFRIPEVLLFSFEMLFLNSLVIAKIMQFQNGNNHFGVSKATKLRLERYLPFLIGQLIFMKIFLLQAVLIKNVKPKTLIY